MKRIAYLTLCLALSFSTINPAQAASKIGTSCKRVGMVLPISGGYLLCTKTAVGLKYENPPKKPLNSSVANPDEMEQKVIQAFNAYDHEACKGSHRNFIATFLTSPGYTTSMLGKQKILFDQAMSCYNNYFDHPVKINVILLTNNDYEFLASQQSDGKPLVDQVQLRWAKFMMDRISSSSSRFAGSAGWSVPNSSAWVLMIDSTANTSPDSHGAAHEFVHILQSYSKSIFFPNYGDGSTPADYVNMPTWFWEGSGELLSYASLSKSAVEFSNNMREVRNQAQGAPSLNKISTNEEVIARFQSIEDPNGQEANYMCYALGSVLSEYILATFGYQKYFEIMKNAGTYRDFNDNLIQTIGLSKDELYKQAAPFVLSQWKQNSFN